MYTEQQVRNAIKFACEQQKFEDYQFAGECLIVEDDEVKQGIDNCLNGLCETSKTALVNFNDAINFNF